MIGLVSGKIFKDHYIFQSLSPFPHTRNHGYAFLVSATESLLIILKELLFVF